MKLVTGLLAAVLLLAGVASSQAVVRIADDRGGRIGTYVDKYQGLRTSGETVIIDGLCASACTIILGAVSHDKICVTSHATLGFPQRGGLTPRMLFLRGRQLQALYKPCYLDAQASAIKPTTR